MQNRKLYPENWADEIRPSILRRDEYKCQHCGLKHRTYFVSYIPGDWRRVEVDEFKDCKKSGYKVKQIILQVAHKDNNKSNSAPENLITLCQPCHHEMDKHWKLMVRLSNLHKQPVVVGRK